MADGINRLVQFGYQGPPGPPGGGGGPGGGGSPSVRQIVWKQLAVSSGYVYGAWAEVKAIIGTESGWVDVLVDDSLADCVVDDGTETLCYQKTRFISARPGRDLSAKIKFTAGSKLVDVYSFEAIAVEKQNLGGPVLEMRTGGRLFLDDGSTINNAAAVDEPAVECSASACQILMYRGSSIYSLFGGIKTRGLINCTAPGGVFLLLALQNGVGAIIQPYLVEGRLGLDYILPLADSSSQVPNQDFFPLAQILYGKTDSDKNLGWTSGATGSEPANPDVGQPFYNTTTSRQTVWDGVAWVPHPGVGGGGVTNVTGSAPIASTGGLTPDISIAAATTLAAGSMSALDKAKLDGVTATQVTYREGGVTGPGVVATWAEVETFATAQDVPWTLFCDSTLAQCTVPNTTIDYDFRNLVRIQGLPSNPGPMLLIQDGGSIKNILTVATGNIECEAITLPGIKADLLSAQLILREGGVIGNQAGSLVAALQVNTSSMVIAMFEGGLMTNSAPGIALLDYTVVGGFQIFATLSNTQGALSTVSDDCITRDVTTAILNIHDASSRLGSQSLGPVGPVVYNPIARSQYVLWETGNTAGRPTYALPGQPYANTDLGVTEHFNGTQWKTHKSQLALIGDGVSTTINVVHGLGTYDVMVQVYEDAGTKQTVLCDVQRPDPNSVDLVFVLPPALNSLRVMVKE